MESMMIRCILGEAYAEVPAEMLAKVKGAVVDLIGRTTGVQTLIQMRALGKLVGDFGYVESSAILGPAGYKEIYNAELLAMVEKRADRVRKGGLSVEDVTMKGALPFLERLRGAGVRLCLASGTDADDVRREASLLGYAELFDGGIFGSVGDIDRDSPSGWSSSASSTSSVRAPEAEAPASCSGTAPWRCARPASAGATAIGLVSDEAQRFGVNPRKRSRLVLAGADLLMPDFSWAAELFAFLGWEA